MNPGLEKNRTPVEQEGASIRDMAPAALTSYVEQSIRTMGEDEVTAVLRNRHCDAHICQLIAQNGRLTGFYDVRLQLVSHRATPHAQALKFINYLYWSDLVRISTDVKVHASVRRAVETRLAVQINSLTLGEKVSIAKSCSRSLIKTLLRTDDPRIFAGLLINPRLVEDDLVALIAREESPPEHLRLIAGDPKWGVRYEVRRALVMNANSPRAVAASQLRHLSKRDLEAIVSSPRTSLYLRRCIERIIAG